MRITWLLEATDRIWGGVKVALDDANWLHDRGHQVTVLSRTGPPAWMTLRCAFRQVADFRPEHVPASDVVIGTFWTTVPAAVNARRGVPVHYCQGYEGDTPEAAPAKDRIEQVYRMPEPHRITIAKHLTQLLQMRFQIQAREIVYAIDHDIMRAGELRPSPSPVRIGLVGPYQIAWKDIATGLRACELAFRSGLDLQLVRVTNTEPDACERALPFPVEWHERVPPARMGEIYRSLDLFLGTSRGGEEGFFLPAVEAMACGVPCVLTDIPCFRGYGEGQYALFVPPQDPAAMAEAIVVASRMQSVRNEMRTAGLAVSSRYRRDAHGAALEQALLAIAATAAPVRATGQAELELEAARVLQQAADKLGARGEWQRAVRFAEAATVLLPEEPAVLRELMKARFLAGDDQGALQACDRLCALGTADAPVHAQRARLLYAAGRHDEAAKAFRTAIATGRDDADLHNDMGVVLYRCGDVAGARQSFQRSLSLRPDHADARANLQELAVHPRAPVGSAT